MKGDNRKRPPRITRRNKNANRIVRVRDNRTDALLQSISDELGVSYQTVFDEYLEFADDHLNISFAAKRDMIVYRLLDKYTGGD